MGRCVLKISLFEAYECLRALASENRLAILELLGDKILNVQRISAELGIASMAAAAISTASSSRT